MEKTIQIDCPPGDPRPGDLIAQVMVGSGVEFDGRQPITRYFGEWTWDFSDVPDDVWQKAQPTFKERLTKLFNDGFIRYCSW